MASEAIRVTGFRELLRAMKEFPEDVNEEITDELKEAAEPVGLGARSRALTTIRNMPQSPEWAAMRIGVSKRAATVWVAPELRGGRGSSRPNLAGLLATQMEAALEENREHVIGRIDNMIDRIADDNGF